MTAGGVRDGAIAGHGRMVACPECGRRYRVDEGRLKGGRRLRCGACRHVFAADEAPLQGGAPVREGIKAGPSAGGESRGTPPLVLIGDGEREFRNLLKRTLEAIDCRVEVTDDGEAAFRFAVARRPDLMILNVYLRNLLGVAVCEGIKRSPDLKGTKVALMGSVFKSERFAQDPGDLYGADDYFEDVIPETEMRKRLLRLLGRSAGRVIERAEEPTVRSPTRSAGEFLDPHSEIRRLARIMVSDLKIYHPEGFRRALLERTVSETFREELVQARDLITHRFPDLPDRLRILSEGLREALAQERARATSNAAGSPA